MTPPRPPEANDGASLAPSRWIDLNHFARVELSSNENPVQLKATALAKNPGRTWRPKEPGPQTIRLVFEVPQSITKVRLVFIEEQLERTQEFVLRWRGQAGKEYQEIVRQQYVLHAPMEACAR